MFAQGAQIRLEAWQSASDLAQLGRLRQGVSLSGLSGDQGLQGLLVPRDQFFQCSDARIELARGPGRRRCGFVGRRVVGWGRSPFNGIHGLDGWGRSEFNGMDGFGVTARPARDPGSIGCVANDARLIGPAVQRAIGLRGARARRRQERETQGPSPKGRRRAVGAHRASAGVRCHAVNSWRGACRRQGTSADLRATGQTIAGATRDDLPTPPPIAGPGLSPTVGGARGHPAVRSAAFPSTVARICRASGPVSAVAPGAGRHGSCSSHTACRDAHAVFAPEVGWPGWP